MKTCSLNEFMEEIRPWLDRDYIRGAHLDDKGRFVLYFLDGMKNVYQIDDCNKSQIESVILDLKKKGIPVNE